MRSDQFTRALEALARLAAVIDAPLAVVGGLAGIHHGAMVTTLDINIVVDEEKLAAIIERAPEAGCSFGRPPPTVGTGWRFKTSRER